MAPALVASRQLRGTAPAPPAGMSPIGGRFAAQSGGIRTEGAWGAAGGGDSRPKLRFGTFQGRGVAIAPMGRGGPAAAHRLILCGGPSTHGPRRSSRRARASSGIVLRHPHRAARGASRGAAHGYDSECEPVRPRCAVGGVAPLTLGSLLDGSLLPFLVSFAVLAARSIPWPWAVGPIVSSRNSQCHSPGHTAARHHCHSAQPGTNRHLDLPP